MQDITQTPVTTRRRAGGARRAAPLLALGALLLCGAGLARAQEGQKPAPKPQEFEEAGPSIAVPRAVVNVKSFEDVALAGRQLVERGKLGPETALEVTATAERAEDGRLRPESVKIEWHTSADEAVAALAQRLLVAFSESRVLAPLEGVKTVRLGLKLDRQNVSVLVAGEMPSEVEAARYAEGYGFLLKTARMVKSGTDEGRLYERIAIASEGKTFKMTFEMPRGEAARMISEMLARRAAKAAAQQD